MKIDSLIRLYELSKKRLEGQHGTINITFANRSHVYTGNDVIGNCLQEWLPDWFQYLGVDIKKGDGSQKFPDFVLTFNGVEYAIEVKAWNINNAPAFDLANFNSFLDTTYEEPGKLNAYYFILGYRPDQDGFSQGFIVEKVFLKSIWEITSSSKKYPIGLQVKRNQPYAMRPYNFYKRPKASFKNKGEFIDAVAETYEMFPNNSLEFTPEQWVYSVSRF